MRNDGNPPVLVVGAGPTGLTLAVALRGHGIGVRLIDRAPAAAAVSKALAIWSGSLEVLAGLGAVDPFLARGARLDALRVGSGERELAALKVGAGIDSPYPFPLLLPQSETEAILRARATELGVAIERGVELVGLTQDAGGVAARLRHADAREETQRFSYLVGCDGARSFVRHALGIAFEGYTEAPVFLLGDVAIRGGAINGGALDHRSIYLWWRNGGTVALFPFAGETWRLFTARAGSGGEDAPDLAELQALMDRHGPPGARLSSPSWLSAFRINERLAARYRLGRVFLAGDAAHVHSPAGGQGMNTGIQDAANLAWKLALALRGRGDAELLLESYQAERRPIARHVIDTSAQRQHVAFARNPIVRSLRAVGVAVAGRLPALQKRLQMQLSETEIVYRDGPLVALGIPPGRPRRTDVGTRARDADFTDAASGTVRSLWPEFGATHHTLIVFEKSGATIDLDAVAPWRGDNLKVLRATRHGNERLWVRYRQRVPGWLLVRPDQVIAARGAAADLAPLVAYLARVLGPAAEREAEVMGR